MSALIMEEILRTRKILHLQNVFLMQRRFTVSKKFEREKKILFGHLDETLPQKRKRLKLTEQKQEQDPAAFAEVEVESVKKRKNKTYQKSEQDFLIKYVNKKNLQIIQTSPKSLNLRIVNKELTYNLLNKAVNQRYKYSIKLPEDSPKKEVFVQLTPLNLRNSKNEQIIDKEKIIEEKIIANEKTIEKEKIIGKENIETKNDNTKTQKTAETPVTSNATAPTPIIIQNMLSFSFHDSTKSERIARKELPVSKGIISLPANADIANKNLPSVTRILSATMSDTAKKALAHWKEEMIKKLGEEGFNNYQQNLFKDGHDLHSSIENALLQKEYQIPEKVKPAFESVQNVLKDISSVSALETHVVHPKLFYRGITDCVATYRDELCLIDWKKSDKRKDTIDSIYDAPLQVASYIGAMNSDMHYPFEIKKGLVVVAYTSGEEATVYEIVDENLFVYWKAWLKRLQKYFVDTKKM